MNIVIDENEILLLQKMYGVDKIQDLIKSGEILKEKYINVFIKQCIENGICYIPDDAKINNDIQINYTFEKSQKFWTNIYHGDIDSVYKLETLFGVNVL